MLLRRITAALAMSAAAVMTIHTGTAQAAPAVGYSVNAQPGSVVTHLDGGVFKITSDGKFLGVTDADGAVVAVIPLLVGASALSAQVSPDGTAATVTPSIGNVIRGIATSTATPVEDQLARNELQSQIDLAIKLGAPSGSLVGAVVGCLIGLIGIIVGCVAGIPVGIAVGAVAGTLISGGPGIQAAWDKYNRVIASPPCTTEYAVYDKVACG